MSTAGAANEIPVQISIVHCNQAIRLGQLLSSLLENVGSLVFSLETIQD